MVAFVAVGVLLAVTLPYHEWDSFAFGDWSRAIAQHGKLDPLYPGPQSAARPLFYELQGIAWSITGISFSVGRLLSLAFALVLIAAVVRMARALGGGALETSIAVVAVVAIPVFAQQALSGQTDVPAAATVALAAALTLRPPRVPVGFAWVALAAFMAVLAKQNALLALGPLAIVLFATAPGDVRARLRTPVSALAGGLVLGLAYDEVMAERSGLGLVAFLRAGSTGYWAELAARARHDALLRADVLGSGLRLPLLFALVYAVARLGGLRHRVATPPALAVALAWSIAGPLAAGIPNGAFARSEDAFTFVGFTLVLAAVVLLRDDEAPSRRTLAVGLALALPPLAVWIAASAYTDRLASAAWPGAAVLIAVVVAAGVRGLARAGVALALAPVTVLALAAWMSLATFDGLHGSMWAEYRALGWSGLGDDSRTMHVVLPALQSTIATSEPPLGNGRLVTGDPMFPWFLPGRVDTATPGSCHDVRGYRVFVLLTGNESIASARGAGRLATPQQWAACRTPKLRQLSDGANGYAVFAVGNG